MPANVSGDLRANCKAVINEHILSKEITKETKCDREDFNIFYANTCANIDIRSEISVKITGKMKTKSAKAARHDTFREIIRIKESQSLIKHQKIFIKTVKRRYTFCRNSAKSVKRYNPATEFVSFV